MLSFFCTDCRYQPPLLLQKLQQQQQEEQSSPQNQQEQEQEQGQEQEQEQEQDQEEEEEEEEQEQEKGKQETFLTGNYSFSFSRKHWYFAVLNFLLPDSKPGHKISRPPGWKGRSRGRRASGLDGGGRGVGHLQVAGLGIDAEDGFF